LFLDILDASADKATDLTVDLMEVMKVITAEVTVDLDATIEDVVI